MSEFFGRSVLAFLVSQVGVEDLSFHKQCFTCCQCKHAIHGHYVKASCKLYRTCSMKRDTFATDEETSHMITSFGRSLRRVL